MKSRFDKSRTISGGPPAISSSRTCWRSGAESMSSSPSNTTTACRRGERSSLRTTESLGSSRRHGVGPMQREHAPPTNSRSNMVALDLEGASHFGSAIERLQDTWPVRSHVFGCSRRKEANAWTQAGLFRPRVLVMPVGRCGLLCKMSRPTSPRSQRFLPSELVTNAIVHAASEPLMAVYVEKCRVRVEVHDSDRTLDLLPLKPEQSSPHGRGLAIVDSLASLWGVEPREDGKPSGSSLTSRIRGSVGSLDRQIFRSAAPRLDDLRRKVMDLAV